ncbi:toprim domain-containing protein [Psychrobacillus sp. OK032]|uniref:toprim domain-containing protein n=1 Tax=Psychrobacillus sp. OK032 TaxID=1884358 RepID=UPI0008B37AEA|nr:toprim domain-containing protein [Psychrobacillus sp. OK032]SER88372.1 Toprim-like [Psychrobacillus sp. OK032]
MPIITVRGQPLNVDIRNELDAFEWLSVKPNADKLIAASPFRYDKTPSFFVNYDGEYAGCFGDSGAYDSDWASGNFTKLLAFLRNETYEETEDYLVESYGIGEATERQKLIVPPLKQRKPFRPLDCALIEQLTSPYLTKRGISPEVQARAGVGKTRHKGFVAIPWYLPDGRLANVKYRATRGKTFFYEKGAHPIRQLVYGANVVTGGDLYVCEAEIDALSWQTAGFNAVAVGGVAFNRKQADIIRCLPYDAIIAAGDNDKAGRRFNEQVAILLRGERLYTVNYGAIPMKDANAILTANGPEALRSLAASVTKENTISVGLTSPTYMRK